MTQPLKIIRLKGQEIVPYIADLAQLRIEIFRDYPYLYLGDLEKEYQRKSQNRGTLQICDYKNKRRWKQNRFDYNTV